jgi:hypothetical protein
MVLGQSLGIRDWQFYDNYVKRWHFEMIDLCLRRWGAF